MSIDEGLHQQMLISDNEVELLLLCKFIAIFHVFFINQHIYVHDNGSTCHSILGVGLWWYLVWEDLVQVETSR